MRQEIYEDGENGAKGEKKIHEENGVNESMRGLPGVREHKRSSDR